MLDDAVAGESAVSRAPFVLHVVWHPQCGAAHAIAEELRRHFASDRYNDIAGGAGVTVLFRDVDAPDSDAPPAIDWTDGEIVAAVALLDRATTDGRWVRYPPEHRCTGGRPGPRYSRVPCRARSRGVGGRPRRASAALARLAR